MEANSGSKKEIETKNDTHNIFGYVKQIRDVKAGHFNQRGKKLGVFNIFKKIILREQERMNKNLNTREKDYIYKNLLRIGKEIKETSINIMLQLSGAREEIGSLSKVDVRLQNILSEAQKSSMIEFYMISMFICGKISKTLQDYARAIWFFKQAKRIFPMGKMKLRCYKNLGNCFQHLRKFNLALYYFKKLLQIAWVNREKIIFYFLSI